MTEPVSLDLAKAQCGIIDDDSRDELIAAYIAAARAWVEGYTGHVLVRRAFTEQRDSFGRYIEIARRPVVEVTEIGYTDTAGNPQTYTEAVYSLNRGPARIYPALSGWWPALGRYGGVSITYTAGYAAPDDVPEPLCQAILLLVEHWNTIRSPVDTMASSAAEIPFTVTALCDQYRTPSL